MSITVKIQGQTIDFPTSGEDPNWAEAITQFAQAVEAAIATVAGDFDIAPQVQNIDDPYIGIDIPITNLKFPSTDIVSAEIQYGVVRQTDLALVTEGGVLSVYFNDGNPIGNKWSISQVRQGDAKIEFTIDDTGQMFYTSTSIGGTPLNHEGFITFRALTVITES